MNAIDLAVIGTILLSGALALWRGLVRELLSLAAWTGAAIITVAFYTSLQPSMRHHFKSELTADAVTALTLFCGSLVVLLPIGYLLGGLVRGKALTAIDRSLGFVFGLVRGVLVVCLLFLLTLWVWPNEKKEPEMLSQAKTRPLMVAGVDMLKSLMPQEDLKKIADEAHALEKKVDKMGEEPEKQQPNAASATTTGTDVPVAEEPVAVKTGEIKPPEPPPAKPGPPDTIGELIGATPSKDTHP